MNEIKYFIELPKGKLVTKSALCSQFKRIPEELRWDYCDAIEEYIYCLQQDGALIDINESENIVENSPLTPKQYGKKFLNINIPNDIAIDKFDELVADNYGLWNYPLSEYSEILEAESKVVIVRFKQNGESVCRFVEVDI